MTGDNVDDHLRAAADCIDDARTDLSYGDLESDDEAINTHIESVDSSLSDIEELLRELAILEELDGEEVEKLPEVNDGESE